MSEPELPSAVAGWYGAAFLVWLIAAASSFLPQRFVQALQPLLVGAGCGLLIAAAMGGNGAMALPLPWFLGDAPITFVVDPLSRWFLFLIGLVGLTAVVFSPGYLVHLRRRVAIGLYWSALALLMIEHVPRGALGERAGLPRRLGADGAVFVCTGGVGPRAALGPAARPWSTWARRGSARRF